MKTPIKIPAKAPTVFAKKSNQSAVRYSVKYFWNSSIRPPHKTASIHPDSSIDPS